MGVIFCSADTIGLIQNDRLPKGNLFDVARAAGFLGAKATPQLLPHCHPVSIDAMDLQFSFLQKNIHAQWLDDATLARSGVVIEASASSIGRTGIEMEVLTAVSVAALEIYDMLKPVDRLLEIGHIRLLEKTGGKSDLARYSAGSPSCAVLVCSDAAAAGRREDISGRLVKEMLETAKGLVKFLEIVPDDIVTIRGQIQQWVSVGIEFIFTTGGTGLGPRDNTIEAIAGILDRDADGITEAMRVYGQMRTPFAMMSRAIAGSIGQTLIVTLPGSPDGARESLEAILPAVFHAGKMIKGEGH
jgi:cyclic pyranopterin phosphate synthase